MDDEAIMRITIVCVIASLLAILGIVLGLGVARSSVPITTANDQVKIVQTITAACGGLPATERSSCLSTGMRSLAQKQVLAYCNNEKFGIPEELCLAEVASGTVSSTQEQGIAICDDLLNTATPAQITACLQAAESGSKSGSK